MFNYSAAAEMLFPTRCAGCGSYAGRLICPDCTADLPLIRGHTCGRCGRPTLYKVERCPECRGRLGHVDATAALAVYEEPLRALIHKLKYGNGWRLAPLLGSMAAVRLAPVLVSSRPLVTFVPMHRRKRRARGYDHAEILANEIAGALGLSALPLLRRAHPTRAQSSLSHEGRRVNVKEAFEAAGDDMGGEEVVLVDDVLTTGYTISECAAVLRGNGAGRIVACVLARDLRHREEMRDR